ncbi:hypothetical protein LCGC14_3154630 [marine sediment metagenome]|uniref:Uncharacterized protein n=1 Tax=marine sediment metagenome TaxID=412755 RepID=A0A0F8VT59_9ZZZZ
MTEREYVQLSQDLAGWACDLVETIEAHCKDERMVQLPEFKNTKTQARKLLGHTIEEEIQAT